MRAPAVYRRPVTAPTPFLFDLDGTLADTLPDIAASVNHVRARYDLPPLPLAAVRPLLGDGARVLLQRALQPALPAEHAAQQRALDAAFAAYGDHHRDQFTVHARLFPGVRTHLDALAGAGHPLAVVTNKPERFARPLVAHLGLGDLLRVLVGGDTVAARKPDPAPLRHALRLLGAAGGTMVGDGVQDLRAAKTLGLPTIGCLYGYGDPAALRAEGADAFWRAFGEPA